MGPDSALESVDTVTDTGKLDGKPDRFGREVELADWAETVDTGTADVADTAVLTDKVVDTFEIVAIVGVRVMVVGSLRAVVESAVDRLEGTVEKTVDGVDFALLDEKGLKGRQKNRVKELLDKVGVQY